ncbi:DUF2513 domain-containing protein [Clostridium merdae]|uniref:DUF2513 domain-containing protein n=1 Tax=Clostridium merdae TaxID=1958780 RepID=UPI000A271613|nr:DUF2513 domain-containing protein [Clostridium merdae]
MKLNPDCIRDILLMVEEESSFRNVIFFKNNYEYVHLQKYSMDEVCYHINQCKLTGFLTRVDWTMESHCYIYDLSPYGHEFLANIRTDTNWNKVKQNAKKVGSESLSILAQIAAQVISNMLTN